MPGTGVSNSTMASRAARARAARQATQGPLQLPRKGELDSSDISSSRQLGLTSFQCLEEIDYDNPRFVALRDSGVAGVQASLHPVMIAWLALRPNYRPETVNPKTGEVTGVRTENPHDYDYRSESP